MVGLEINEDDLVLGIVEKIESNTVFVRLEDNRQAALIISEIAPGRIKNLREYVVPNKKIICKVLRIQGDRIDLSLRRVTSKEKKDFLEKISQETQLKSAFRQILKEKFQEINDKILNEFSSYQDFAQKLKEKPEIMKDYLPKEFQDMIDKVINKKQKEVEVKKIIKIKCLANDGIIKIREIFKTKDDSLKITYLAAGSFQVKAKADDYKKANQKLDSFVLELEKKAKKDNCEFEAIAA